MNSPIPPFTRSNRAVLVIGIVCLVITFAGVIFVAARNDDAKPKTDPSLTARVADRFGRLPLSFEANRGQVEQPVKFLSNGPGYRLFLTANEAVLSLRKPQADTKVREGSVLRLKMIGANAASQVEGQDELPGKVNYFIGNDPEKWQRNVPTYRKVHYKDVYPGIDVVYYGNQRELEYDFVVAPGANPKAIKFTVAGADKISLDETGSLLLNLKHGEVRLNKPVIYQLTDTGSRREVKGEYVIKKNEIRFKVQAFDSGKPLVIDPVLSYSTFLGSAGNDSALGIAVDSQGNAYVTGSTDRSTFPTTAGAFKTTNDSGGAFVSKLDSTGSTLVYSTYLSSSATGRSIAVDASGNAYVTGNTTANDFPIVNGLKTTVSSSDAFITKLNPSGSGLLFSTLVGGTNDDFGNGIAVDSNGNIAIAGSTFSTDFPTVNAIKPAASLIHGCATGFVTRLDPSAPSYVFSTYLGGSSCDAANGVAVDPSGNVYVVGQTNSSDFPTANAFQDTVGSSIARDAFVTKFTTTGALAYSTYLGGSVDDLGFAIAVDASGNAYVTGTTESSNFPTLNPIQTANNFGGNAFVTKLNSQGSGLVYSTYLGAASARGIAVDSTGNAYVTGFSSSGEFPLTAGALRTRSPIYKSTDEAANWSNDNYGLGEAVVIDIVVNPIQPWILYAGTGKGVFKSTDGGRNWAAVNNGLNARRLSAIVIDPLTPSTLYVATNEFNNANNGIYKTTDGGNSWNLRKNGLPGNSLLSLDIDPVTPTTLYAGLLGTQIYKTDDGADNWTATASPSFLEPVALAVDPLNHTKVYVADFSINGGILRSTNSGTTWQYLAASQTRPGARSISISPVTSGLLYIGTSNFIFKSTDGGDNWSQVSPLVGIAGRIVVDPVSSSTLYYLTETFSRDPVQGVLKSTDGGQTWKSVNRGLHTFSPSALAIDPLKPSTLHLASMPPSGDDAFVTKINPAGSALVYSTFIGGTMNPGSFPNLSAQGFGIAVDSAGNAYVTGLAFASDFPTTPNAFQPFSHGGNEVFISKLSMSYLISGHVLDGSNAPVGGVDVVLSDGSSITSVTTEGDGSYQFSRLREGGTFTVSATKPHFTIAPSSQTFNNLNSDQVLDFTATATNAPFFTISGQVTENGVGLAGVAITLSGSQSGLRTTDSNGNYSFELAGGGNYTVTPSRPGFTFAAPSQAFDNLSAPQTANFVASRQSFVVTNDNNHGPGSLRDAILNANANDGKDTITFNIPGAGVKVISLSVALPEITEAVVIDGTTQPGYAGTPLIELDGTLVASASGLVIKAGGSTVKGLAIGNFSSGNGIWLNNSNSNVIQANYIGVDAAGTTARRDNTGILLSNSSNNLIGGTTAAARNVISGNGFAGIEIFGTSNTIQGNFIGTNADGTAKADSGGEGIRITSSQSTDNVIGGTAPGAGNLISGNQTGISTSATRTIIQGNLIGTDVTGTKAISNVNGIHAAGSDILVGGLTPAARNIISGNDGTGVTVRGSGSRLQGNLIGTDITGMFKLPNANGVVAGTNALVGGTVPGARNVITGSLLINVVLGLQGSGAAATVQGNYIGTDVTGNRALSNSTIGISASDVNHLIGGTTPGAGNVISGNLLGIQLSGQGHTIQGNLIGLNALGTGGIANVSSGIFIANSLNSAIGGTQSGAANKIAFNGSAGITVIDSTRIRINGNSIFSNGGLGIDLGADGVTSNDTTDTDTGANLLQNFPVLTSVQSSGGSTTIQGSLKSTPSTKFQIDFYSNAGLDPSGNGEGALFFNTTEVTTNGNGDATISVTFSNALPAGRAITATATDPNGNTSEFSAGDESAAGGSVHFTLANFQVIEDIGLATITVQRSGGSAGNLSVDYATEDGSAIAGQDYTATSGTLNFGNGETSKTFQIPITDDGIPESSETVRVTLRTSAVESLGSPDTMVIFILDGGSVPSLFVTNASVIEGSPGTTTQAIFTLTLSAVTGKTVSVNYATANATARGGAACGDQGVDYESLSGTFTFQPGQFTTVIPVKVCGDTNAESNESFVLNLSNASNASISDNQGVGTIVNDDVLELLLDESGPGISQAAVLESNLFVRDPFHVLRIDDWNPDGDRNTRVVLFARNLQLDPGENFSAVNVNVRGSNNQLITVFPDDVRAVPNTDLTQVVFRLPTTFPPGTVTLQLRAHGRASNIGTFRIAQ